MDAIYMVLQVVGYLVGGLLAVVAVWFVFALCACIWHSTWRRAEKPVAIASRWLIRLTCPLIGLLFLLGLAMGVINGRVDSAWGVISMLILAVLFLGGGLAAWRV